MTEVELAVLKSAGIDFGRSRSRSESEKPPEGGFSIVGDQAAINAGFDFRR
jgi:hypothetical protein